MVDAGTINCVTGFVEVLGGSYVGWFGEVGVSPVVNQTYYIKVGWGIAGNPCTGGAYVHTEIQLPSFTSLAVTTQNKVRCFYKSPTKTNFAESPNGCPQSPTSVGLYGGLSFDPVGATAWPSAFGSLFEIWIPVKTTQPLNGLITGGSTGCPACLFAGTWMIDGWDSPWVFPVQGVYVKQGAAPPPAPTPYVDYPTPNNYSWPNVSFDWATAGYVFNTTATSGAMYVDIRAGTSGAFSRATTPWNTAGSWKIEQPWSGLTPGGTYQFRVCYDPDQGGSSPEVCGAVQTFKRPGGVDGTAPNTSIVGKPTGVHEPEVRNVHVLVERARLHVLLQARRRRVTRNARRRSTRTWPSALTRCSSTRRTPRTTSTRAPRATAGRSTSRSRTPRSRRSRRRRRPPRAPRSSSSRPRRARPSCASWTRSRGRSARRRRRTRTSRRASTS